MVSKIQVPLEEALRYLGITGLQETAGKTAGLPQNGKISNELPQNGTEIAELPQNRQEISSLLQSVKTMADLLETRAQPRWIWKEFQLEKADGTFLLPEAGISLSGKTASLMLGSCRSIVILACTLGAASESLMRSWQARDMARAVILDACGSALIEAGCDAAEKEILEKHPGMYLTDRFSPGYGDLPLALQKSLIASTNTEKLLGIEVTRTNLLIPRKTVTAFIGISETPQKARIRGCAYCSMRDTCRLHASGSSCRLDSMTEKPTHDAGSSCRLNT